MRPIPEKRRLREHRPPGLNDPVHLIKRIRIFFIELLIHVFKFFCVVFNIHAIAYEDAHRLQCSRLDMAFKNLPAEFDGLRILFLTDFHIDLVPEIGKKLIRIVESSDFDLCLMGGDYTYRYKGHNIKTVKDFFSKFIPILKDKCRDVYGVLGNHDYYELGQFLHSIGAEILVNESCRFERNGAYICLSGIDDPAIYKSHDLKSCESVINDPACFKILVSHAPDIYKLEEKYGYSLMLSGHTHGGQICLPGGTPLFTHTRAPNKMAKGAWDYKNLRGFTSTGIGCSGFAGRFYCPPEVVIITLKTDVAN